MAGHTKWSIIKRRKGTAPWKFGTVVAFPGGDAAGAERFMYIGPEMPNLFRLHKHGFLCGGDMSAAVVIAEPEF